MQKPAVLPLCGLTLALAALVANHAFGRLQLENLRRLPVETFPRRVGGWIAGPDRPIDPEVLKALPTARVVDRVYRDMAGREVALTLVTASDASDLHDPNWCLPGQGWALSDRRQLRIGAQAVNAVSATHDREQMQVLYWQPGADTPNMTLGTALAKASALSRLMSRRPEIPLSVRLMAMESGEAGARADYLVDFARQMQAPLDGLARAGAHSAH